MTEEVLGICGTIDWDHVDAHKFVEGRCYNWKPITESDRHHLEAMLRVGIESADPHVREFSKQTAREVGYKL